MPDSKTSSSSSSSRPHDHNQGNQNRSYTAEQKAAVDRVRKCKATDFYAILDVEKSVTADGVKKAYRRLALVMHPDKNGAPGADEAFKLISKAFQVLSDPQQREHFDKFGGDPTSRSGGGGGGGGGGGDPFAGFRSAGGGGFAGGPEISPEELFNMFFGGGFGGAGPFGGAAFGGGPFGEFVTFGGPGIRVQHFGGPGMRRRRPAPGTTRGDTAADEQEQQQEASLRSTFIQLLPLIILFIFPILSGLFSELGSGNSGSKSKFPDVRFHKIHPFTQQRFTEKHHIPYWVSPKEMKDYGLQGDGSGVERKLKDMDRRVEIWYINTLQEECKKERVDQQIEIEDARGWFWVDEEKLQKARDKPLPACQTLRGMGEGRVMS